MFKEEVFKNMRYLLRFPNNYLNGEKYPVIIFMHGAGTRGNDIEILKSNPYFIHIQSHKDFPFITVAPQCDKDTWFDMLETVNDFAKYIAVQDFADKTRIYLMGASMGGYAVWQMAMSNPSLYAAIVPICGGGMYWNAYRLANIPVWAFHGDIDQVVNLRESQLMVDNINTNGGNAKLTVYTYCGHDAWSETYKDPKVFEWLLNHKKESQKAKNAGFNDSKIYG